MGATWASGKRKRSSWWKKWNDSTKCALCVRAAAGVAAASSTFLVAVRREFGALRVKSEFVVYFLFSTACGASLARIDTGIARMNAEEVEVQELLLPTIAKKRKREEYNDQVISPPFPVNALPCSLRRLLQLPPAIALPSTNPDTTTPPSNQHPTPRRIETVVFSGYEIQTWYSSPYPAEESTSAPLPTHPDRAVPAKSSSLRHSVPSTSTLPDPPPQPKSIKFTVGEHKKVAPTQPAKRSDAQTGVSTQRLFVCDGCFKYMVQPAALTAHKVSAAFRCSYGAILNVFGRNCVHSSIRQERRFTSEALTSSGRSTVPNPRSAFSSLLVELRADAANIAAILSKSVSVREALHRVSHPLSIRS